MRIKTLFIMSCCFAFIAGCGKKYSLDRELVNSSSEWRFYRGDIGSKGSVENSQFNGKLDVLWEYKSNDKPVGPLTIYNGSIVYPGSRNRIKFISADLGKYQGYIKPRGVAQTGLVISDSLGYFATAPKKSKLRCVNLLNRKTLWKKDVKDAIGGSILIEEKIILSSAEGKLKAFDKITGELLWEFKRKQRFTTPPLFDGKSVWQVSEEGGLFAVNPEDGVEILYTNLENPVVASIAFDKAIFVSDLSGIVYKIDTGDGHVLWQTATDGDAWGAVSISGNSLVLGHSGGEVLSLAVDDGTILWRFDVVDVVTASVLKIGEYVAFGSKKGEFFLLDASDGTLVEKRKLKGAVSFAPVSDGQHIFVATDKGMITCFGVRNEKQTTKINRINTQHKSQ